MRRKKKDKEIAKRRICAYLTDRQYKKAKAFANKNNIALSTLVKKALEKYTTEMRKK